MAYLTVNGVEVQCDAGAGSDITPMLIGEDGRAFSGAPFSTERATKGELSARTMLLPVDDVPAWRGLIKGEGHVWSFDGNATSSRGVIPSAYGGPSGLSPTILPSSGRRGGCLSFAPGTYVTYDVALRGAWTAFGWRQVSGTWRHYGLDADGNDIYNGVVGATPGDPYDWLSVDVTGLLRLEGPSGYGYYLDDLVVLPYVVPSGWWPQLYAFHSAQAFPLLPRVSLDGDVVAARLMSGTAMGRPGKAQAVYQGPTPTFSFEFTLRGV